MKRFQLFYYVFLLCFAFTSTLDLQAQIIPNRPEYASALVSHNVPSTMLPGQKVRVQLHVRNMGYRTWTYSGTAFSFRLGAGDGIQNQGGLIRNEFLWSNFKYGGHMNAGQTHYGRAFMGHNAYTNQIHVFEFDITAPTNPGTRYVSARMVHELETWFGTYITIPVTVQGATQTLNAALTVVSAPSVLFSEQPGRVIIRARNTGTQTWNHTGSNPVRLAATSANQFVLSNFSFGGQVGTTNARANMNQDVPPGGSIDFAFDISRTTFNTRSFKLSLRMLKGNGTWFGNTINRNITVRGEIIIPTLKVSPVPAINKVKISLDKAKIAKGSQVILRNMSGMVVKSIKVQETIEQQSLDTKNLKPGIYFLTVKDGKETVTKRIKVQ